MISFQPNCTLPVTTPSGYVNGPNIRATTDIVWSCGSVLVLSTWSVLHLNVPPDLETKSKLQSIRKYLYSLGRKLGWMGIMLAFPEYLVGISTTNLFAAWVNHPQLKELAKNDDVPWSLTHTILANIGGIAIRFSESNKRERPEEQGRQPGKDGDIASPTGPVSVPEKGGELPQTLAQSSVTQLEMDGAFAKISNAEQSARGSISRTPPEYEAMPAFIHEFQKSQERHFRGLGETPWEPFGPHLALAANARATAQWVRKNDKKYNAEQIAPLHGNIWVLDSKQLALARSFGVLRKLPCFSKEEIDDKSKIDGLMRLLAVIQVFWLAVQLIARRVAGTPSSALEISTVAFSACAIIIYLTEWAKPKDIGVPFYIDTDAVVSPATFSTIAEAAPITFLQARRYYIAQSCVHQVVEGRFQKKHIDRMMVLMTIVSITLYGGIHLFAWNLDFPTPVEQLLWRIAALTVAIAPTISALLVTLEDVVSHRTDKVSQWSVIVLAPAYLAARLYIIVESFRSLYFLPPEAFVATWAANAPHIG